MICETCGLPKDLCVCGELEKEEVELRVRYDHERRWGKTATIVEPIDKELGDELSTELKKHFACGGTWKDNKIVLLGEHEVVPYLKSRGYNVE